jgi:two-component system, NarL family, sensor histidine kinase UhpB
MNGQPPQTRLSRAPRPDAGATPPALPAVVRRLLGVRLLVKILIANAALVAAASAATALAAHRVRGVPDIVALEIVAAVVLLAVAATLAVNALILRLALTPLRRLERTADRVQEGDLDARAPHSPLADREFARLTRLFNAMLDGLGLYRQRLREVAARALNAEEEERKRISRELHDETAQRLAALLIRLRLARTAGGEQRDHTLDEVRAEIADVLDGIRRYARGLRPPALDELGLAAAIESYARSLSEATAIQVHVAAPPLRGAIAPETELAVYRIVQEALSNVVRHAGARRADVRLERSGERLLVSVRDDGEGFPAADVLAGRAGHGLGLFGMQERAAYVGGVVAIASGEGEGTTVRVDVPLSGPAGEASRL